MSRRPFRVEVNYSKSGKPKYYLVRDIKVKDRKSKVKKYLGVRPPSKDELARLRQKHSAEMEVKAALRKGELSAGFSKSKFITHGEVRELEQLRWLYKSVRELMTTSETEAYQRDFEIHYVQGTTSIEGNTLTLREAANLLLYGTVPERRNLREINEVQNFRKVAQYRNRFRGRVTTDFIRTLHRLIMDNIDLESAGTFRRIDSVFIEGCDLALCPSVVIEEELQRAIDEYYGSVDRGLHPFEQAVLFHYHLEMIHPFTDGNGRVGREVLNYMLMRSHFPRLLFIGKEREQYIAALQHGNEERHLDMVKSFIDIMLRQRMNVMKENLERLALPARRVGQMQLGDFVSI